MANRLILELLHDGVRVATASARRGSWRLGETFEIPFASDAEPNVIVATIAAALSQRGIRGKVDLDVIVTRRSIELREITLPPSPDNEIASIVKFSARNHFTAISDSTLLDFVPVSGNESTSRVVLAATLNQAIAKLARDLAESLNAKLRRILVHPWCIGRSAMEAMPGDGVYLVVDPSREGTEFSLWSGGRLLMTRGVNAPGSSHDESGIQGLIQSELNRCLMVASRSTGGRAVDRIIIIGSAGDFAPGNSKLLPPVTHFKPAGINSGEQQNFAAHVGAAMQFAEPAVEMLDFSNFDRHINRDSGSLDWKKLAVAGGALAATLLIGGWILWSMLADRKEEIARLTTMLQQTQQLNAPIGNRPDAKQVVAEVGMIDDWIGQRVNWVRELSELSSRMLTADEVVVNELNASVKDAKVTMFLKGNALNDATDTSIQTLLAQRPYELKPGTSRKGKDGERLATVFENSATLTLDPKAMVDSVMQRARELVRKDRSEADTSANAGTPDNEGSDEVSEAN